MKIAVITGANGFVGSHVVQALSTTGYHIYAVLKNEKEDISYIRDLYNVSIIYCDLVNISNLPNLIDEKCIDIFYHFAWIGSAGPLREDYRIQLQNADYACQTIEAAKKLNCKRFIFASSIMEYECFEIIKNELDCSMNHIYSAGKVAAHFMTKALANRLNMDYISVVISNIFGPREISPRLINTTLCKLLRGEATSFTKGDQMYDFIYISDAVAAFIAIGETGLKNRNYYLGSIHPRPLKEFLNEMKNCVNVNLDLGLGQIEFTGKSIDYENTFDIFAVMNDTGFIPQVSFSEGITMTMEWIMQNMPSD